MFQEPKIHNFVSWPQCCVLPFSLHELGVVTFIAGPLSLPLDVLHHEDDDGEGVEGEDEEDVEVSIAVVPSNPSLLLLIQQS